MMPVGVLRIDSPAISYVTGYDPDGFFIALTNESARPVEAGIRIDIDAVPLEAGRSYAATITGVAGNHDAAVVDGRLHTTVAPGRVTFVRIAGVDPFTQLQRNYFRPRQRRHRKATSASTRLSEASTPCC